jgi:hypothetical protein
MPSMAANRVLAIGKNGLPKNWTARKRTAGIQGQEVENEQQN